jgi:hypothetical protein
MGLADPLAFLATADDAEEDGTVWVDVTKELKATPEAIFDIIADVEREPEWIPNVQRVRRTSEGPVAVGTTWVAEALVMGRSTENPTEMTELDRPGSSATGIPLRWRSRSVMNCPRPMTGRGCASPSTASCPGT